MIPIPGFIIAIATFPGVIVHELAHQLFCRLTRTAVIEVCYFQPKNPAGFVVHEIPSRPWHHLLIGVGPFLVNTVIGALIALPAALPVIKFGAGTPLDYLLIWLGVSIAMHAFPSTGDAQGIWQAVVRGKDVPLALRFLAAPLVGFILLGALGSVVWLDALYGVGVAMLVPNLIVGMMA